MHSFVQASEERVCHAYCRMTSHYHVVVETPEANLSKGMRQLNGVYTQRTNRRHGLVGHLVQGRFKAIFFGVHYSTVSRAVRRFNVERRFNTTAASRSRRA